MGSISSMQVVSDSLVEMRAFVRPVQNFFERMDFVSCSEFLELGVRELDDQSLYLFDMREHSALRELFLAGGRDISATRRCWILGPDDSYYRREFFKLGCDFYLDSHTHSLDIYSRVIGAQGGNQTTEHVLLPDGLKLDLSMQQLYTEGESCGLSSTEFRIFMTLLESPSSHLKREEIRDRVWGRDFQISVRSIDSHISRMRRKIPEQMLRIEADRNKGYRLNHPAL